jgi:hypothetical protein
LNGGSGRGALQNLPYLAEFNRNSSTYQVQPIYCDPVPRRALELAERANSMGVPAKWIEERIERCLPALRQNLTTPLLLNIDKARDLVVAIRQCSGQPVLAYLLIKTPNSELLGIRVVIEAHDNEGRERVASFFEQLGEVTARRGSNSIFGENGEATHMANEPVYRNWFARHAEANLPKLISGLEPDSALIEVTKDGSTTMPLQLHDSRHTGWAVPEDLASEVADSGAPMLRGENFVVGEEGPDGIRFHQARVRKTDRVLTVKPLGISPPRNSNDPWAFSSKEPVLTTD